MRKSIRKLFAGYLLFFGLHCAGWECIAAPAQTSSAGPGLSSSCTGDRYEVDLSGAVDALPGNGPDDDIEQVRDWMWASLLARLADRGPAPELLEAAAQTPLYRDESLWGFRLPNGRTRSTAESDGTVLVLVDQGLPDQIQEAVLEAVDRQSFQSGKPVSQAEVYGLSVDWRRMRAEVCRLAGADSAWLHSPDSGFRTRLVRTPQELGDFLRDGVDLLSASCIQSESGGGLEVSGRRRARAARAPITAQHIAHLSQSPADLESYSRDFAKQIDAALEQAEQAGFEPQLRSKDPQTQNLLDRILEAKQRYPQYSTQQIVLALQLQDGNSQSLGFSLEPSTNVPEVLRRIERLTGVLKDVRQLPALLKEWGIDATIGLEIARRSVHSRSLPSARQNLAVLLDQVRDLEPERQEWWLLQAVNILPQPVASELLQEIQLRSGFQCAEYVGPLRGTSSGMTLFYTDLLAKLWAMDWGESIPSDSVHGFVSIPRQPLTADPCRNDPASAYTRLWFGIRDEGFARTESGGLLFSPNASRIFARGSALGPRFSQEGEPGPQKKRFVGWWDAHYSTLAEYEPQYELLNQFFKWTLVRRMAESSGSPACLAYAPAIEDRPAWRLDDWMAGRPDLRWREKPSFLTGRDAGPECLPFYASDDFARCGITYRLSGGISLPDQAILGKAARPARAPEILKIERAGEAIVGRAPTRPGQTSRLEGEYLQRLRGRDGALEVEIEGGEIGHLRLLTADRHRAQLALVAQADDLRTARLLAERITERLNRNESLKKAVKQAAGDQPAWLVSKEEPAEAWEILIQLRSRNRAYALMSSQKGIRGPPISVAEILDWRTAHARIKQHHGVPLNDPARSFSPSEFSAALTAVESDSTARGRVRSAGLGSIDAPAYRKESEEERLRQAIRTAHITTVEDPTNIPPEAKNAIFYVTTPEQGLPSVSQPTKDSAMAGYVMVILNHFVLDQQAPDRIILDQLELTRLNTSPAGPSPDPSMPEKRSDKDPNTWSWPVILILPCEQAEEMGLQIPDSASCNLAPSSEEALEKERWAAVEAVFACDLNGDSQVAGPKEDACLLAAIRDHGPVLQRYFGN